jgi:hypothetical protein
MIGLLLQLLVFLPVFALPWFFLTGRITWLRNDLLLRFVLAFGLGPAFAGWTLHLFLWIIPGMEAGTYVFLTPLAATLFPLILHSASPRLQTVEPKPPAPSRHLWGAMLILLGMIYLPLFLSPLLGHDMLEYLTLGAYFAEYRTLEYLSNGIHLANGFHFVGLHGYTFPMIKAWQELVETTLGISHYDMLVKTASTFYAPLLLVLLERVHTRMKLAHGPVFLWCLVLGHGFLVLGTALHIDALRVFLFSLAVLGVLRASHPKATITEIILIGSVAGIASYTHSLSMILLSCWLFFDGIRFARRLSWTHTLRWWGLMACGMLLGGAFHYLVDIFTGTGWIFKSIRFY